MSMKIHTCTILVIMMASMTSAQRNCETVSALQLPGSAVLQEDSKADSLNHQRTCVKGNLFPSIYVLGAQKSATTTLHYSLGREAGVTSSTEVTVLDSHRGKESFIVAKYLSHYAHENMKDPAVLNRFAEEWRGLFKTCEKFPNSSNVGEYSAHNLAFTDPAFAKDWPALSVAREDLFVREKPLLGLDLPPALRHAYGDSFARVRFVVLLREPISRVHSLLYQFKSYPRTEAEVANFDPGSHLREELRAMVDDNVIAYNIWHGLYGRHLLEWFSYWPSSQFLVVPYKYVSFPAVCQSLKQHLAINMECSTSILRQHFNNAHRHHPTVEQEVPEDLLRRANQALNVEFKLLVDVLVNNSNSVVMPRLKSNATPEDVEQWLVRGW